MADESPKAPPPPESIPASASAVPPPRVLSAICPGDLGLKAGYRSDKGDPVTFRSIVGWVTVVNADSIPGTVPFLPIVLNDLGYPVIAGAAAPGFFGTFGTALTPADALAKAATWEGSTGPRGGGTMQGQGIN
jgi:hypothetical protein